MISFLEFESFMPSRNQVAEVEGDIHMIRGQRVMLDADLAKIYGVSTKQLNQQLKRNAARFPEDFVFQLAPEELTNLKSQIATSSSTSIPGLRSQIVTSSLHGGRRYLPWVFTEHGAIMLASVLNSETAIEASVRVVRAFVRLRELISANTALANKFSQLERRLDSNDAQIAQLFAAIRQLLAPVPPKKREIGFHVRERSARYRTRKRA